MLNEPALQEWIQYSFLEYVVHSPQMTGRMPYSTLKNSTLLHLSMLLKPCNLQFKQILAQQIEISFIYTKFLIFLLFYLQSDSSASQGHLQRPQGFNSSAYFSSQLFAVSIPETQILQLKSKLLRENSQLPIRKMNKNSRKTIAIIYFFCTFI